MADFRDRIKSAIRPIILEMIDDCVSEVIEECLADDGIGVKLADPVAKATRGRPRKSRDNGDGGPNTLAGVTDTNVPHVGGASQGDVVSAEGASLADRMEKIAAEQAPVEADVKAAEDMFGLVVQPDAAPAAEIIDVPRLHKLILEKPGMRERVAEIMAGLSMRTLKGVEPNSPEIMAVWSGIQAYENGAAAH